MFSKDCVVITWNRNYEIFALKMQLCSKGYTVHKNFEKQSSSEALANDLSETYESLEASENSICIINGGEGNFVFKDLQLPILKDDLILQSLSMQVDKNFPFHANSFSLGFRKLTESDSLAFYRLLCISKEKWNELVLLCQSAKYGVDAFIPGFAILDTVYKNQTVAFNAFEYEIDEQGQLHVYEATEKNSALPFELNNDVIEENKLANYQEALLLAHYGLSKDFLKEAPLLSPLPKVVRPKRYEKAKNLIQFQLCILAFCLCYLSYLFVSKTVAKGNSITAVISELNAQNEALPESSSQILLLEDARNEIKDFQNNQERDLTEALFELTRLLPENYSIQSLSYSARSSKLIVAVRMNNGVATELTGAFNQSEIFKGYPVFSDSGNRLTLTIKSKQEVK